MKAISLWQPWATLIALNEKRVETRGRKIHHRGEIAIHAAQRFDAEQRALLDMDPFRARLAYHGITRGNLTHATMPRGAIVAVAELVDDLPTERLLKEGWTLNGVGWWTPARQEEAFGNYAEGRRGYLLRNIRPLRQPVLCRGMQAVPFEVPPDVVARVRLELEGVEPR